MNTFLKGSGLRITGSSDHRIMSLRGPWASFGGGHVPLHSLTVTWPHSTARSEGTMNACPGEGKNPCCRPVYPTVFIQTKPNVCVALMGAGEGCLGGGLRRRAEGQTLPTGAQSVLPGEVPRGCRACCAPRGQPASFQCPTVIRHICRNVRTPGLRHCHL